MPRGSARRGRLGHRLDHQRRVHGGRVDFQDLDVVGAVELVVHDAGRLQHVGAGRAALDPDHVGAELSVRRLLDAEVAILHEAAQPGLVDRVLAPAHAEALARLAHHTYSFPRPTTWPVSMSISSRRGPIVRMASKPSSTMS